MPAVSPQVAVLERSGEEGHFCYRCSSFRLLCTLHYPTVKKEKKVCFLLFGVCVGFVAVVGCFVLFFCWGWGWGWGWGGREYVGTLSAWTRFFVSFPLVLLSAVRGTGFCFVFRSLFKAGGTYLIVSLAVS